MTVLLEAFDPHQPRWPKGHPKAGQWRPKGGVGGARLGGGSKRASAKWLERDLAEVRTTIAQVRGRHGTSPRDLDTVGDRLLKIADRYGTTSAYEKRLTDIVAERVKILDDSYERRITARRAARKAGTDPDRVPRYTGNEDVRLRAIAEEEVKLRTDIAKARRDALVFALSGVRQMGGVKPKVSHALAGEGYMGVGQAVPAAKQIEQDLREVMRYVPADWTRSVNRAGGVGLTASDTRAHATKVGGLAGHITNTPLDDSTMLHEFLHVVEWRHGERSNVTGTTPLQGATYAFRNERTRGEPLRKLSEIAPWAGYRDNEVAQADQFFSPYVGKRYTGEYADSTEVLTMGAQFLFFPTSNHDPRKNDPETARAIMGMLATL